VSYVNHTPKITFLRLDFLKCPDPSGCNFWSLSPWWTVSSILPFWQTWRIADHVSTFNRALLLRPKKPPRNHSTVGQSTSYQPITSFADIVQWSYNFAQTHENAFSSLNACFDLASYAIYNDLVGVSEARVSVYSQLLKTNQISFPSSKYNYSPFLFPLPPFKRIFASLKPEWLLL